MEYNYKSKAEIKFAFQRSRKKGTKTSNGEKEKENKFSQHFGIEKAAKSFKMCTPYNEFSDSCNSIQPQMFTQYLQNITDKGYFISRALVVASWDGDWVHSIGQNKRTLPSPHLGHKFYNFQDILT